MTWLMVLLCVLFAPLALCAVFGCILFPVPMPLVTNICQLSPSDREVLNQKSRYEVGLEKLANAASEISVMSKDLTDLQPQLVEASRQVGRPT